MYSSTKRGFWRIDDPLSPIVMTDTETVVYLLILQYKTEMTSYD